ncbi:MAG TPA: GNAT family N-acetyltransferase [Acidimicrobiia bacterium]|nr:GNAT family N-acetyltransferase [Acidimicrobiia bacterium]
MDPVIREAQQTDIPGIASWTSDTFSWGDYVADALPKWISDPSGAVLVAEVDGEVAGMARVSMVSSSEAWAQGARVHPDHRRTGLGSALTERLAGWVRERGALVLRLAVEHDNETAQRHVESLGFRPVSDWWEASRLLGEGSPVPEGNGGRRVQAAERLQEAHSAEAEPAFLSWSAGELAIAARGLFPINWIWRKLTLDHLDFAARNHALWEGRPGWAMLDIDHDGDLAVYWLETAEADARAMVRALIDCGVGRRARQMDMLVPDVGWLREALLASAFDLRGSRIYALPL